MNLLNKSKNNGFRGYIFSREINGNFIPQRVQNLVIKDFAIRKDIFFKLSSTEYIMKNSYKMLESLMTELNKLDGVIFYSLEMLPYQRSHRITTLKKILSKKKIIFFALEEIKITKIKDINKINDLFSIKNKSMNNEKLKRLI